MSICIPLRTHVCVRKWRFYLRDAATSPEACITLTVTHSAPRGLLPPRPPVSIKRTLYRRRANRSISDRPPGAR
eukprot:3443446-Prymnesium_polylepis.1